jgi:hypothetical protein
VELYGSSACTVPALPEPRRGHVTFLTGSGQLATCGGYNSRDCLVQTPGSGWEPGVLGSLTMERYRAAVTTLHDDVFVIGGNHDAAKRTMDVLMSGTSEWQQGPVVPIDMYRGCAVSISEWQLLIIDGTNVHEFDSSVAGVLSTEGWRPGGRWPDLVTGRTSFGCAVSQGLVVVAGGGTGGFDYLRTTEIINIATRTISFGPEMQHARINFHLAVLPAPGGETDRVLVLGGTYYDNGYKYLGTVEELVMPGPGGSATWAPTTELQEGRALFGAVGVPTGH